jgi:hypothetical protein
MNTFIALNPVPAEWADDGPKFSARIEALESSHPETDEEVSITATITNIGRAFWPAGTGSAGMVTVGPYLLNGDGGRVELPRLALERSLSPGESLSVEVRVPRGSVEGSEEIGLDLVREGIAWFADYGSTPAFVRLTAEG